MDKFAIVIVFYVIVAIVRLLSSAAKSQAPGKKPTQIRLKPEDLQRIAKQRQQKVKPLNLTPKTVTPPPLPNLLEPFFEPPQDEEEALDMAEELPEALEVSESDVMPPDMSSSSHVYSSFLSEDLGKNAFQGIIWSEILRPPVSLRR